MCQVISSQSCFIHLFKKIFSEYQLILWLWKNNAVKRELKVFKLNLTVNFRITLPCRNAELHFTTQFTQNEETVTCFKQTKQSFSK